MTSSDDKELNNVIDELIFVLECIGEKNWSSSLRNLQSSYNNAGSLYERKRVLSKIIQLYGGMGSFADLTLYRDGRPLIEANDILDRLQSRLFDIAVRLR